MTFTYNGTLTTDLDTIRFRIGDVTSGSGIRPDGGNFTDEEINGLLALEGTVGATIAGLYERLAGEWSNYVDTKIGARDEKLSAVADRYMKLAREWRNTHGNPTATTTLSTGFVTRVDGYSDDIDSGEA